MKKITFLLLFLAVNLTYSQWRETTIPYSYSGKTIDISNPSFPTADIGYVTTWVVLSATIHDYPKLWKTTNKGVNWEDIYDLPTGNFKSVISLCFVNVNTGYCTKFDGIPSLPPYTLKIYKTINGGNNWNNVGQITNITHPIADTLDHISSYNYIKFVNETTGYLCEWTNVYKTTNGGVSWNTIKTFYDPYYIIVDIAASNIDNTVYIGGYRSFSSSQNFALLHKSTNGGINFTAVPNADGSGDNDSVHALTSISLAEVGSNKYLYGAGIRRVGEVKNNSLVNISDPYLQHVFDVKYINFSTVTEGVLFADNRFRRSTNSGTNWSDEYYIGGISLGGMSNTGDVVSASGYNRYVSGQQSTYVYIRKFPARGQYAFDLVPNPNYPGGFNVDDLAGGGGTIFIPYIPQSSEVYGGTLLVSGPDIILENGNKIFYKWESDGLNPNGAYVYSDRIDDPITVHYKTKLKSTIPNAISPVSQTKAIKDTNGVINLLHESMGGIFYTWSTDNGVTFETEETVNYHPNEYSGGNYNSCLAEIKPYTLHYPPISGQTNMAAVWERKEGTTIKIRFSERKVEHWQPLNWTEPIDLLTISSVPDNFKCYPKLFMVRNEGGLDSLVGVLYLRPVGGVNQLWVYGKNRFGYNNQVVASGLNISSFSAAAIMQNSMSHSLNLHVAYVQNGRIMYLHGLLTSETIGVNFTLLSSENKDLSDLDVLQNRGEPDITLRNSSDNPNNPNINMQPVVTFKGQYNVIIKIYNGDGNPTQQNLTYYPVVIRERYANGNWAPGNIQYNSAIIQQSPNIEGSKLRNSFILNYKQGASLFWQKVVRWNNVLNSGYFCEPANFSGTDAKIVRGALIDQTLGAAKIYLL